MVSLDTFRSMGAILFHCGGGAEGEKQRMTLFKETWHDQPGMLPVGDQEMQAWGFLLMRLSGTFEHRSLDGGKCQTDGKNI